MAQPEKSWISRNIQNYIFVASRNAAINYLKKELAFSHGTIEAIQADVRTSDTAEDNLFAKRNQLVDRNGGFGNA